MIVLAFKELIKRLCYDVCISIQDMEDPASVNITFQGASLSTTMSRSDSEAFNIPGADGFSFDSAPLFKVGDILLLVRLIRHGFQCVICLSKHH